MTSQVSQRPAETIRKVIGLLMAGVPAEQALAHFGQQIELFSPAVAQRFERTWVLSQRLGGSPKPALQRLAEVLDAQESQLQQIELAYAAPKATARLVMGLPIIALLLGQLLGLNPVAAIIGSPIGFISFALGLVLLVVGQLWVQQLLVKAQPSITDPGEFLDAVAVGLQAGLDPNRAEEEARTMFEGPEDVGVDSAAVLNECKALALSTGSSIRHLILDEAQHLREARRYAQAQLAGKLQIRLMLPLGLSTLPAFVLLAVAPMALGLITNK